MSEYGPWEGTILFNPCALFEAHGVFVPTLERA